MKRTKAIRVIEILIGAIIVVTFAIQMWPKDICQEYCKSAELTFSGIVTGYNAGTHRHPEKSFVITTSSHQEIKVSDKYYLFKSIALGDSVYKSSGSLECTVVKSRQVAALAYYSKWLWRKFDSSEIANCNCNKSN